MRRVRAEVAAVALLFSCLGGAAEAASLPQPPPLHPGTVLIYVYNANSGGLLVGMPFFIDGTKVAAPRPGGCSEMVVPAGPHEISAGAPLGHELASMLFLGRPAVGGPVTWNSGRAYLIRIEQRYKGAVMEYSVHQDAVSAVSAPSLSCRYSEPMNLEKLTMPPEATSTPSAK